MNLLPKPAPAPLVAPLIVLALMSCTPGRAGTPPALSAVSTPTAAATGLADLPLDSLLDMPVTGASRFVQRRSLASSAVTVITREEIIAFGHRTLADVLRGVRGVAVSTDRTYDYVGVRGFLTSGDYNTRVLVLVDGNRVNDPLFDQAFIGQEFPLDLSSVERIEFVPGQGSAVYGANALFGVVNVITREAPRRRQAEVGLATGSAGEREVRASLRQPWDGGGLQVQASRQLRQGETLFHADQVGVNGSDGWARGADYGHRGAVSLRLDQGGFTASLLHASRLKGTPMAVDLVYDDPRNHYHDRYSLLNLEHTAALGAATRLTTRAFAGRYRFEGDFVIDYPPVTLNRDEAVASWRGLEMRVSHTGLAGHRLVAGADWQDMPTLRQRNVDVAPMPALYLDDQRRSWRTAVYAEDQWTLDPAWELHLGARIDDGQGSEAQVSPRAALVWSPDPAWSLKLIHGTAFRRPNAYEAHYVVDAPAGYMANPALTSERVRGTELVAEWRPQHDWRLSASLYRNAARRLLQLAYDPDADRYQYGNTLALDNTGGELEAEYAQGSLRWRSSYSAVRVRGSGAALSTFAHQMLKGSVMAPLGADWTIALEAQAVTRRASAPGHALVNLSLHGPAWEAGPALTLALRNLGDRRVYDPGIDAVRQPVVPLSGRQWRLDSSWPLPF